jgi:hypothetical protein
VSKFWRERNLAVVLVALFLVSWLLQGWFGWHEFQSEQASHGEGASLFGQNGYVWPFMQATLENWQSEFLQLLTFVVLTGFLIYKGSPESRDSDDEMKATLERIEARLRSLEPNA